MSKLIISDLIQIFKSCVTAVMPEKLIRNTIKFNPSNEELTIAGERFCLTKQNLYLIGMGKAVQNMAKEVEELVGIRIRHGIISVPIGSLCKSNKTKGNVQYFEGARNNLPDNDAQETALKVKNLAIQLSSTDILLVLISGGGSALLPLPKEPMTLEEKTALIKMLAYAGADITELNTVRKKLSQLKGGQLAIMAQPAEVISLILSDIVGDPLDLIASGPTTENKDDPNAAIDIIKKYNLYNNLPNSIKAILESHNEECFPKNKVRNYIIGSNKVSIEAAVKKSKDLSYSSVALSNSVTGNVKEIAQKYVKLSKIFCDYADKVIDKTSVETELDNINIPGIAKDSIDNLDISQPNICLILGGEITVEVKGKGKGGRNQQLALEFSNFLNDKTEEFKNFEVYLLSAGTDGIDGPTDAAGAIGYKNLIADAKKENIYVNDYIKNNDSYNFYKILKEGELHVLSGHTNTNVMDIHIILIRKM